MDDAIFDLNAAAQQSDIPKDSIAGMIFGKNAVKRDDTLPYWDLNDDYLERTGGGSLTEGQYYTHAFLLKWRASDSGYRTLFRHHKHHCVLVEKDSKSAGFYTNTYGYFKGFGYNVRVHAV